MKTEQQFFEEAISMEQYMNEMENYKEESNAIYRSFTFEDPSFIEQLRKSDLHILTITEDWCGDAMLNNPIMRRIAQAASIDIRIVKRDADTSLIDQHLTNGGRSIPIYLFLNDAGDVIGKWGPRARELQQFVDESRATLPDKEDPTFAERQKEMYSNLIHQYKTNESFHTYIYESMKTALLHAIN